ncbi:MAG TPA: hypothetical protein VFU03_10015 [Gemmatimonadales bacterium]|nr:hypothetical protein [Gemmatimonadales bacterium]
MVRPVLERPAHEFGPVVHGDRLRGWPGADRTVQGRRDVPPREAETALQERTLPTPLIDDRQDAKRAPIGQLVVHEVHAPPILRPARHGGGSTVQRAMFPAAHPHAHLQPLQGGTAVGPASC